MYKLFKCITLFILTSLLLTGCYKFSTPEQLIQKPKTNKEKELIKKSIEKFLPPGANLTIPLDCKEAGAINEVDIDGDNKNEIIAFYEEQEKSFEIGFIVLKKINNTWEMMDSIQGEGFDISYASFYDLNQDGKSEIIISWDYGDYTKIQSIYTMDQNKIKRVFNGKHIGIKIDDLNNDKKLDIFLFNYNSKKSIFTLSVYNYNVNKFKLIDKINISSNYEVKYSNIEIGKASKNKKGVFVDIPLKTHSAYTELIFLNNNKLEKAFKNSISKTYQIYPVGSNDIDNDGIIEIGVLTQPVGYEKEALVNIPWINTWYKWDEKKELSFVVENYYDYDEGYRFNLPKNWKGKFTLKECIVKNKKEVIFYSLEKNKKIGNKLLTIVYFNKSSWKDEERKLIEQNKEFIYLGENKNTVFIGFLNNNYINKNKRFFTTKEDIYINFKLLY
ncbi:hypothetical protein [Tepidibacter thalassicus]|uniref:Repeat domain-containing protein n=1 Tax=Tepidibacter thalassicus DSM 15285 TaxID=1123350 RepID=A0A1M5P0Z9_9FIRM|nr:hypothetical protein [Tepidibacter thalassicus]SHG95385.1 hypothetical protein SAMN02744040_00325 [Tepidibacter thalassicus DSM 15285]